MRAEAQAHVDTIKDALELLRRFLDWDRALRRLDELNARVEDQALWNDPKQAQAVMRERRRLDEAITATRAIENELSGTVELIELAEMEGDEELEKEAVASLGELAKKAEGDKVKALLAGEADANDTYLEINAGAGGTESQDWAGMLQRMYTRWAERHGMKVELVDYHAGEQAGIKSATLLIKGENAYGYAKVESGVLLAERWIIAALRHWQFFSIEELNQTIRELLPRINSKPFRKRHGSRTTVFEELDKPALQPLPAERFDLSQWSRARVNIDYHIAFDTNYYSVPYNLVHEVVEVRSTPTTIEVFHKGQRVGSHLRGRGHGQTITNPEHRPRSHQAHLEWTPSRMLNWAHSIGPHTAQLFERILADKPHPEMGYRSCLGLIRLAARYSPARMEAAAERALITGACRYQSVKSILKNSLDRQPLPEATSSPPPHTHDNIRGAEYFE